MAIHRMDTLRRREGRVRNLVAPRLEWAIPLVDLQQVRCIPHAKGHLVGRRQA